MARGSVADLLGVVLAGTPAMPVTGHKHSDTRKRRKTKTRRKASRLRKISAASRRANRGA